MRSTITTSGFGFWLIDFSHVFVCATYRYIAVQTMREAKQSLESRLPLRRRFQPLQIAAGICDPVVTDGQPKIGNDGGAVMEARYGFHALRHAAASASIKQRIDLKRLQVWIGHESIQLTLDTYGHLIDDTEEDARLIEASHTELIKPV